MQKDLIQKIKNITLKALVSDDYLLENLTLKGGNALDMIYRLNKRGSKDLDFSLQEDFSEDFEDIKERVHKTLYNTFLEEGFVVIDYKFLDKPANISSDLEGFWGGYDIEFKIVSQDSYDNNNRILDDKLRRKAILFADNGSPKIEIDISKYEYVGERKKHNIDGLVVYVYAPVLILFEKVRAICQQTNEYGIIVKRDRASGRARDFYDIYSIMEHDASIDIYSEENQEIISKVFDAKRVPLEFIKLIPKYKEIHEENFQSLQATTSSVDKLESFEFYYSYVTGHMNKLLDLITKNSSDSGDANL
jgi:predicted nucleotidyltransferase component of viral defense system